MFGKIFRRITIAHHRKVILTEAAEAIHAKFIDDKKDLWHRLGYFFLELFHNFEDIILSKHLMHLYDSFSKYYEDIFLMINLNSIDILLIDS